MSDSETEQNDPELLIDDGLGNIRRTKQRQRNDLRLNYDTDSGDEIVANQQEDQTKEDDNDDDDDMFASDKEDEVKVEETTKGPEPQFLDVDEFEKQEGIGKYDAETSYISKENDHESHEGEVDDVDVARYYNEIEDFDGERVTKKEPKLEAFDLKEESTEGKFDLDGNFIRHDQKEEPNAEDEWLDGYKKHDIAKAKAAQERRELAKKRKMLSDEVSSIPEILIQLIPHLEPAETPIEALARLNPKKLKKKTQEQPEDKLKRKNISEITHFCTLLSNENDISDIYEMTREELMRYYKSKTGQDFNTTKRGVKRELESDEENRTGNDNEYGEKVWEFRWKGDEEVKGPYSSYEMNYWKETYFEGAVEVRRLGEESFKDVIDIQFEQ
ncbi:uncharacterized protein CANTADRAFT_48916 [Suhomyces tanzawaensis NRRL Y-17324]|uniref:GYF domain-containing protein n=1 Tax=Suhomyces tanzawaensis NRRL Y-17324 TaxID=984487 RepID=A0A1E4SKZ1_9ASCO|nr:uncharacterized protein CANTADRAFT_48916 [Suhomyces tanzawaensis NRRL Y-17324]ODV80117.1 hypothetical protein CANTADRAFT_48916 [Suhomyces tanzawaensis NRRL Y-17324]